MTAWVSRWVGPLSLGIWLGLSALWPVKLVHLGTAGFLWQPVLVLSLLVLAAIRSRRVGWLASAGQALWMFAVLNLSAWLPVLRSPAVSQLYPRAYEWYLIFYEIGLAVLIGFQAALTVVRGARGWWMAGRWSRPLVIAPVLLVVRGIQVGHWVSLVIGVAVGVWLARRWQGQGIDRWASPRSQRFVACGIFVLAALLVFGAGMRVYSVEGANFPFSSDDGPSYFRHAVAMAESPGVFWTNELDDQLSFSGYYPVMALWFMLTGPHIPAGLILHGLAGGLLAVVAFWLGRRLCHWTVGLIAGGLIVADHVLLHLLATVNMETFFLPTLYLAVLLWVSVVGRTLEAQRRLSGLAGLALGMATFFRPTAAVLPVILVLLCLWERPRPSWQQVRRQTAWMVGGFALPVALMVLRHRLAWGYWTLGGQKAPIAIEANTALEIAGQHPLEIGWWPWLRLLVEDPSVLWRQMIPEWWNVALRFWTHRGFGQMDLVQGVNAEGFYQAALTGVLTVGTLVGAILALRLRTRLHLMILSLPVYFTSLVVVFYFQSSSRYRSPFLPALYLLCCLGFSAAATTIGTLRRRVRAVG